MVDDGPLRPKFESLQTQVLLTRLVRVIGRGR